MKAGRVVAGAVVLGLGGFVLWAAFGPGGPAPAPPGPGPAPPPIGIPGTGAPAAAPATAGPQFSHPSECRECHPAVYEEWSRSMHGRAWTDPEVRSLSDSFKMTECISCHAPQPIFYSVVGERVFERSTGHGTGVDCLSCHLLPDGGVAAVRDLPDAPCRPRRTPALSTPVACKGCHNQHYLVDEWQYLFHEPDRTRGALLEEGRPENCLDCHSGEVDRGGGRKGRDHVFPGGHYEEVLRRGMAFRARVEDGRVVAATTSVAVGHRAPADSRHRSFNVWVTVTTEGGVKVHDRKEVAEYRMYYRDSGRENTNLRPGETATATLVLPRGVRGRAVVELVYAMNPIRKEKKEAKAVHSVELEFDTTP